METNTAGPTGERTVEQPQSRYDVVIVGGGPAGLSAAVALSRARRSVLVIDAGEPRNAPAGHVHNYLGHEGTPPLELLAIGRREVTGYGGEVVTGRVTGIERVGDGGFRISCDEGWSIETRRLLVTTGLVDELPDVAGLAERWGNDVLHCPYCHGWEVRDEPIVVLATGPMAVQQALLWRQWSPSITVVLHRVADLGAEQAEQLAASGVGVTRGPASAVVVTDDRISGVRLADGGLVPCRAVVVAARFTARAQILTQLDLATTELTLGDHVLGTYVDVDAGGATAVAGVWVAGNVADLTGTVISAAAGGLRTAHSINLSLIEEDTHAAVLARRTQDHPAA